MVSTDMLSFIRKHPVGVGAGAAVLIAGLAWLAFGIFGVHTLFIDDVVEEAAPVFDAPPADVEPDETTQQVAAPPAPSSDAESTTDSSDDAPAVTTPTTDGSAATSDQPAAAQPAEIVAEFVGVFEADAHPTEGTATVLGNGTGQRFLRFENFESDNGPDLNVYLVNSSTGDVSDYIDLGDLKGNIGDQNYEIPEGVDLAVYDEVVIWCVRFGVGFGDALLAPV